MVFGAWSKWEIWSKILSFSSEILTYDVIYAHAQSEHYKIDIFKCHPSVHTPGINFTNPFSQSTNLSSNNSLPHSVSPKKNWAQPYQYTQVLPNFSDLQSMPCASKILLNILAHKLLVKCWWNWPLFYGHECLIWKIHPFGGSHCCDNLSDTEINVSSLVMGIVSVFDKLWNFLVFNLLFLIRLSFGSLLQSNVNLTWAIWVVSNEQITLFYILSLNF
jgi:hypothetical protein